MFTLHKKVEEIRKVPFTHDVIFDLVVGVDLGGNWMPDSLHQNTKIDFLSLYNQGANYLN